MPIPPKTTIQFVTEAKEVHGDKYDYSNTIYIRSDIKVAIRCPIHGYFWQNPSEHLRGKNCPYCMGNKHKTTYEFIEEARVVHGDKYDYSETIYINGSTKLAIRCPTHGLFYQIPHSHLKGFGCPECSRNKYRGLVYGIGVHDVFNNQNRKAEVIWRDMIKRCYNKTFQKKCPTYSDCSVCDEWLHLSNFIEWFENPENGYREGYHLDKDILVKGNRVYSPTTCCFVPHYINHLFRKSKDRTVNLPSGISTHTCKNGSVRYDVRFCVDKHTNCLGSYASFAFL